MTVPVLTTKNQAVRRIHDETRENKNFGYHYVSGLVRALELKLLSQNQLARLLDAHDSEEAGRVLTECGYPQAPNPETALKQESSDIIIWFAKIMPEPAYGELLYTFHDFHNVKLVLKTLLTQWIAKTDQKVNPSDDSLPDVDGLDRAQMPDFAGPDGIIPFSHISDRVQTPAHSDPAVLYRSIAEHNSEPVPFWLYQAAEQGVKRYLTSYELSQVDSVLDRLAWHRALELAGTVKNPFLDGWLKRRIDLVNIELLLRTRAMRMGRDRLSMTWIPGGSFSESEILKHYDASDESIQSFLSNTPYEKLADFSTHYKNAGQAARFGLMADNCLIHYLQAARLIVRGPEVPLAFVFARQMEIKNIRIILTGLRNGFSQARIRELIRDSYLSWR
jgi:V/A-type H+/Na+-transporting ATPase subunit C